MKRSIVSTARRLKSLVKDRRGGVAVMTAMSLTSLMGFAGLGTEATLWYVAKRNMQGASDAAAYSAAIAEAAGQSSTAFDSAAQAVAKQYGFINGTDGIVVTVNNPPASGNYTGNTHAVEVIVQQPQSLMFASLFMSSNPTISARAVAVPTTTTSSTGSPGNCVIALDRGTVTDLTDSGTAQLNLNSCGIAVNSSSSSALNLSGTATINAESASIVGNYTRSGSAQFNATDGITTGASPTTDPFAGVNVPSYSGCNSSNTVVTSSRSISNPTGTYVFCNGLRVSGTATVTLAPGVYIVNGGPLSVSGTSGITGTGVTIIMTGSSSSTIGSVTISGGADVNITAPTTGATAGIAFYQDRNASTSGTDSFTGGSNQSITGAIYFPSQAVTFSGNSGTGSTSQCTQLIGYTLTFTGTSSFNSNCTGTGLSLGGTSTTSSTTTVALME